jgi:cell wall-associated NlpC family hydrolase
VRSIRTHARRPIVLVSVLAALLSLVLLPAGGASAAPSLSDATKQLDALGLKMDKVNEQVNSTTVQLNRAKAQQAGLNRQLSASQTKLDASQDAVGKIAASAYRDGTMSMTGSLVNSGSPGQFLDQLAALEWLSSQQRATIQQAKAYQAQYAGTKQRVDLQVQTASNLQKQLNTQKATIAKSLDKWEEIRRAAYATKYGTTDGTYVAYDGQGTGLASIVVKFALAQQGEPYVFGGSGPNSWDCSGLTMMAYAQIGVSLPHSVRQQWAMVKHVSRADMQIGDLVFFYGLDHVGIYIGNGQVVHAPTEGQSVKVEAISDMPYYGTGRP